MLVLHAGPISRNSRVRFPPPLLAMKHKVDINQPQIVKELRQLGFSVAVTSACGGGYPDITVGDPRTGRNYLFEIKSPGGKLTPAQIKFSRDWRGQWNVIETTEDALAIMDEFVAR